METQLSFRTILHVTLFTLLLFGGSLCGCGHASTASLVIIGPAFLITLSYFLAGDFNLAWRGILTPCFIGSALLITILTLMLGKTIRDILWTGHDSVFAALIF